MSNPDEFTIAEDRNMILQTDVDQETMATRRRLMRGAMDLLDPHHNTPYQLRELVIETGVRDIMLAAALLLLAVDTLNAQRGPSEDQESRHPDGGQGQAGGVGVNRGDGPDIGGRDETGVLQDRTDLDNRMDGHGEGEIPSDGEVLTNGLECAECGECEECLEANQYYVMAFTGNAAS